MTGDYIKQLQLKKQIEQRAKEAAKSRETAEEKLTQAEESLKRAKEMGVDSATPEKLLTEASSFFKEKDYRSSLNLSTKSMEVSISAQKEKVGSILASADDLRALIERKGVKNEEHATLSQEVKGLLAKDKVEEAYAIAKNLWDKVEKLVNRSMGEAFSEAQSVLLFAEGQGIEIATERKLLEEARKDLEQEKFSASIERLANCQETLDSMIRERFNGMAEKFADTDQLSSEISLDLTKAGKILAKAQELLDGKEYGEAFTTLASADAEYLKAVTKGFTGAFQVMKRRATVLKENGIDVGEISSKVTQSKDDLKNLKFDEMRESLRTVRATLHDRETELLTETILKLKPKLQIAKRLHLDISDAIKNIEASKDLLAGGDIKPALDSVAIAEAAIDEKMKGLDDLEVELSKARTIMKNAELLHLDTGTAKKFMESARKATLSHDFGAASSLLRDTQMEASKLLEEHYAKDVMTIEIRFANAVRVGVDLSEETAMLERIVDLVKRREFNVVPEMIRGCNSSTVEKLRDHMEKDLASVDSTVEAYRGSMDVSGQSALVLKARELLKAGEFFKSHDLLDEALESLKRNEKDALEKRLVEANEMMSILKELNCESVTLKEKMNKANELRAKEKSLQAVRMATEVIQFSRSIVIDELTREMASISRTISLERKKGVEVMKPEHLLEEAGRALKGGNSIQAYRWMREAGESLRNLSKMHIDIYDRIVEISNLIEEAESRDLEVRKPMDMLLRTKRLFESGRYLEAHDSSILAYAETEKVVAPFMVERKVVEANELASGMVSLGLDTSAAESSIRKATELASRNEHLEGISVIKRALEEMKVTLSGGIQKELASCRALIDRSRASGVDVTSAQQVHAKASSLLAERRYLDALRAAQLARAEIEQQALMERKASEQMERSMNSLKTVQELGINISPALEMMNQARIIQKQGNHPLSLELAKRAVDQAASLMETATERRMVESDIEIGRKDLEGPDMVLADKVRRDTLDRIGQKRFKEANALSGSYRDELIKVRRIKETSQRTIADLKAAFEEAAASGVYSEGIKNLMGQADERYRARAFSETNALALRGKDELGQLRERFEGRMTELQSLRHDFQYLEDSDDRSQLGLLLDQADESLLSLDFERSSLFLRRARASLTENIGRESGKSYEELMSLYKLLDGMGFDRSKLPSNVAKLHEAKAYGLGPKELEALNEGIKVIKQVALDEFDRKRRKVEKGIATAKSSGSDVRTSEGLYTSATGVLIAMDLGEAFRTLEKSEAALRGASEVGIAYDRLRDQFRSELDQARSDGLSVPDGEEMLRKADALRKSDATQACQVLKEARDRIKLQKETALPEIDIDIDFLDEPNRKTWARMQLQVTNEGLATARELNIEVTGDVEVKGLSGIDWLAKGEKRTIEASIRPTVSGTVVVKLMLSCKPIHSEELVGYESEFELAVD